MSVRIRLARRGRKNLPIYSIVVADVRAKRDGRFIEKIGTYNPSLKEATVQLKDKVALKWLLQGAQPTNTVRSILSSQGILMKKHLQQGVQKRAITQTVADQRLVNWQNTYKNKKRAFKRIEPQTTAAKQTSDAKEQAATPDVAEVSKKDGVNNTPKKVVSNPTAEKNIVKSKQTTKPPIDKENSATKK